MLRYFGKPRLAIVGGEAIIHNANILKISAHRKTEMNLLLVGILAIQNLIIVLRTTKQTGKNQQRKGNMWF